MSEKITKHDLMVALGKECAFCPIKDTEITRLSQELDAAVTQLQAEVRRRQESDIYGSQMLAAAMARTDERDGLTKIIAAQGKVVEAAKDVDIRFGPHTNECEQALRDSLTALDAELGDGK